MSLRTLRLPALPSFSLALRRGVPHIFNENSVSRGRIVDQHVGDSAHELAVLKDGAARQECGQSRTTKCVITFIFSAALCISSFVGNLFGSEFGRFNASYFDPA